MNRYIVFNNGYRTWMQQNDWVLDFVKNCLNGKDFIEFYGTAKQIDALNKYSKDLTSDYNGLSRFWESENQRFYFTICRNKIRITDNLKQSKNYVKKLISEIKEDRQENIFDESTEKTIENLKKELIKINNMKK